VETPPPISDLRLYDTRRRRVERFEPLEPGKARMYSCGPTVYAPQHIGNLWSQLFADLVRRALTAAGLDVTQVVNITDVGHLTDDSDGGEDKMEVAASRTGTDASEIAARYTAQWERDRTLVGCLPPTVMPRAADHIDEQIAMISRLEAAGVTYRTDDGLYFEVARFPRYTELAHLDLDHLETTGRVDATVAKRHPADFALWKRSPPGRRRQQEWPSPWGVGFPGWHIECSAMATRYLGSPIDVHTGGVDHIGVHHTNEIAQSEVALGVHPWVRWWMHNEFLDFGGEKLAKSTGNVLVLDDLVARGYEPMAFRAFFLQSHYRQQRDFTFAALDAAATGHRRFVAHALAARDALGRPDDARTAAVRQRFWAAVADDLTMPRAMAVAWDAARSPELSPADRWSLLADFDAVLGFGLAELASPDPVGDGGTGADPRIDALVAEREAARAARDFATADRIRNELAAEGVEITDTPAGPLWRRS
jgi:cysteinyl-tRNA synthetase